MSPQNLAVVEIKAFVPARDFALSLEFYQALDFTLFDPSGVLWRIAQNIPGASAVGKV